LRWLVRTATALFAGLAIGRCYCPYGDRLGWPTVSHRCNPREGKDACPEMFDCCSDDPAAPGGALPDYEGKEIDGAEPLFSGINNARSRTGMCVKTMDIPPGAGLLEPGAEDCPIPCNPTWTRGQVDEVCGETWKCCQTVELDEADCVLDEETGCHRPARGDDIVDRGDPWDEKAHETHQDPGLHGCTELAADGSVELEDCYRQLSVADQRGYCMSLWGEELCPAEYESYVSACDQLNLDAGREDCVE